MVFDPTIEIDNKGAHEIIRKCFSHGVVIYSKHVKERMLQRGYTIQDVEHIVLYGKIIKKGIHDKTNHWTYTIQGADLDGDDGKVVAGITKYKSAIIITVLG